jgi:hypothetical protein
MDSIPVGGKISSSRGSDQTGFVAMQLSVQTVPVALSMGIAEARV